MPVHAAPPIEAISGVDSDWIKALAGTQATPAWIADANHLLVHGAVHRGQGQSFSQTGRSARDYFYNDLIGFSREEAPSYGMGSFYDNRREYPPIDRFVAANRFFDSKGIDPVAVGKSFSDSWTWSINSLAQNFDRLERVAGPQRAVRLINGYARVLAHADAAVNFQYVSGVTNALGWGQENADGLMMQREQVLTCNIQLLRTFSRYFASQFCDTGVLPTVSAIGNLMGEHPDKHLIALSKGVLKYSRHYIRKATAGLDKTACRTEALELIRSGEAADLVGDEAASAHSRLHAAETQKCAA